MFRGVAQSLRGGQLVSDRHFDAVFPASYRRVSDLYWTPVDVAVRAALLLAAKPDASILDVGAGIGKFCIVVAALLPRVRIRGVEHRPHFVDIAREAARKMDVAVDFAHGTLDGEGASRVDGIYLFNPFAENFTPREHRLDESVELSEERFWKDVEGTERFLRAARVGTRVVTYCGWGGEMPPEYRLRRREHSGGTIELWVKGERES
jgi:SAM-dependent methyltransferase